MFPRRPPATLAAWLAGARGGGLLAALANQCRFVTGLRVRRAQQIAQLYGRLYSESSRCALLGRFWRRLRGRPGHASVLMAALSGVFVWDEERIQEEELQRSINEMKRLEEMSNIFQSSGVENHPPEPKSPAGGNEKSKDKEEPWEMVMDKKHFKLWRRPITGTHLYQYRVFGTYTDVTPRQFFNVQLDTEYRKKWDALVIKLEVIERDAVSGSEVLHWVTHFPYPMYSRDYVYVRRYSVDQENNVMVLVSRAVEHPSVPESPEFVRVRSYESQMVIRPHKSFDENGFDYLLTYSDNPQTVFPRYCVSWMVSSGMPDFLEKLHMATLKAKNMEIKVKDYISAKPLEMSSEAKATAPSPERKNEGSCGPARIEASAAAKTEPVTVQKGEPKEVVKPVPITSPAVSKVTSTTNMAYNKAPRPFGSVSSPKVTSIPSPSSAFTPAHAATSSHASPTPVATATPLHLSASGLHVSANLSADQCSSPPNTGKPAVNVPRQPTVTSVCSESAQELAEGQRRGSQGDIKQQNGPPRKHIVERNTEFYHIPTHSDASKKRLIEDTEDWRPRTGTTQSRSFRILAQITGTEHLTESENDNTKKAKEKIPLHVFSPKYTKLRDWHHEVSARALNVQ